VIWYQGESNAHNIDLYQHTFPVLVNSWRQKWGRNFPFYYVQLSGIDRPSWPDFRDMERKLPQQVSNIAMAVSMDMGDSLNVHYTRKEAVGDRLALLALHYTYKRPVIVDGPQPLYARIKGNIITIIFPSAQKLATAGNKALLGFELVNIKGQRLPIKAEIKNNTVVLNVAAGEQIKAVWYAMQPFSRADLINQTGLPASTFKLMLQKGDIFY
jgi:sialate O-acetylesterase